MLKFVFKFFAGNSSDPRNRYMHYDGSSAYSQGLQRWFQRDDTRVGLSLSFLYVANAAFQAGPIKDAGDLVRIFAPPAIGVMAWVLMTRGSEKIHERFCERFFPDAKLLVYEDSVYDRTGKTKTAAHLRAVSDARSSLKFRLCFNVPVSCAVAAFAGYDLVHIDGFIGHTAIGVALGYTGNLLSSMYRDYQIVREKITYVGPPPRLEKKEPVPGAVPTPSMG